MGREFITYQKPILLMALAECKEADLPTVKDPCHYQFHFNEEQ